MLNLFLAATGIVGMIVGITMKLLNVSVKKTARQDHSPDNIIIFKPIRRDRIRDTEDKSSIICHELRER